MIRNVLIASALIATVALLALSQSEADGCAAVPRHGEPSIRIAEESAIIVWNPVKKIQHFIRRAAFDTKSPDFGFLVPTPNEPQVPFKEVEDHAFTDVQSWMTPKVVFENKLKLDPLLCMFGCMTKSTVGRSDMTPKSGVEVLHKQKVGGYETSVLKADNTEKLSNWLKTNGYSNDPELQSWLAPYVGAKWIITAFKISRAADGGLATTKAVRMTFAADRPFFPYREPESNAEKNGDAQKKAKAPTEIDGLWKVETAEGNPIEADHLRGTTFWFGNGTAAGLYLKDLPFTVDATKDPKWLDLLKMQGIYKIEGDTMTWCRGRGARPKNFDAKEGLLLTMRRESKADADKVAAQVADREHESRLGTGRLLRVLFVSDSRMEGNLGNAAWHARVPWSDELSQEQRQLLVQNTGVPEADMPAKVWLTNFEDSASPRPAKDEVYFDPAKDQTPIRPQVVRYNEVWIPADVVVLGLLVIVFFFGAIVALWRRRVAA